jgi:GNAT superfamily N-acetyltransferase
VNRSPLRLDLDIRRYRDEDEPRVLKLLDLALGGGPAGTRPPEFFRWKHEANPFGRSLMLVAEHEGRVIGLRAFMRWRFQAAGREVKAVSAVDTATHPDYQGRGVFSSLTRTALDELRGEADLVFNTPNEKSLPGYLQMGWTKVGKVPVLVRIGRPLRFLARIGSFRREAQPAETPPKVAVPLAGEVIRGERAAVSDLLAAAAQPDERFRTARDVTYLEWRYGSAPLLDYRAVTEGRDGRLRGLAIFRLRPRGGLWEATVTELIVGSGGLPVARALLKRIRRSTMVDHLTCHFPTGSIQKRAALTSGFVRAAGGITLAARPLRDGLHPDPTRLNSWALSLGDLEVF